MAGGASYSRRNELTPSRSAYTDFAHKLTGKSVEVEYPGKFLQHIDKQLELDRMHSGLTYEHIPVFVGKRLQERGIKGVRGIVVGTQDSAARAKRLAGSRRRGVDSKADVEGLLVTIAPEASTSTASTALVSGVPIENVFHQ